MRLAGQVKGGFYPAPPPAISLLLQHLRAPQGRFSMLDPCCGEAEALLQLASGLGCHGDDVHAIELSDTRAEIARQKLAGGRLLAPAAFEGCQISPHSFGLMYLNPPFDNELGGGDRVEYTFLVRATRLLATKGILAFVLPEYVFKQERDIQVHLMANFRNISKLVFPEEHRKFNECIVLAVKRSTPVGANAWETALPEVPIYEIPESKPPKRWEKTCLTASEITKLIVNSPLRRSILEVRAETPVPRPPIPLGAGHTALLVASGQLDGIVRPLDEPPHVVRGTVRKTEYLARTEHKDSQDGKRVSTTQVYSERIDPIVRIATTDGEIITMGKEEETDATA